MSISTPVVRLICRGCGGKDIDGEKHVATDHLHTIATHEVADPVGVLAARFAAASRRASLPPNSGRARATGRCRSGVRLSVVGIGGVGRLSDQASASPLIRRREQYVGGLGLSYGF